MTDRHCKEYIECKKTLTVPNYSVERTRPTIFTNVVGNAHLAPARRARCYFGMLGRGAHRGTGRQASLLRANA